MWFRALLITVLIYFVMRSLVRVLHPQDSTRRVRGVPRSKSGQLDESRIQDASFKDIPDK
jgi:hypothetical protein